MADLETLTAKYAPVIARSEQLGEFGAKVIGVKLDGNRLHLKA